MREIAWKRVSKARPIIFIAAFAFLYLHECQGPFWDSAEYQEVSPTGEVKAMLVHDGAGCNRSKPPYDRLVLENRNWRNKLSGVYVPTKGEFMVLNWTRQRRLVITGKRLGKKLIAKPMKISTPDGEYELYFVQTGPNLP